MDTVGEGNGGMNWKNSMEMYKLPSVKYIAGRNLLYDAESCIIEGWDGVESGREVHEGRHSCTYG